SSGSDLTDLSSSFLRKNTSQQASWVVECIFRSSAQPARDANRQCVRSSSPRARAPSFRKRKAPPKRGFDFPRKGNSSSELHVHSFHSAHSAHPVGVTAGILLLFDQLGNHR